MNVLSGTVQEREFVKVFETADTSLMAVVQSVLRGEGTEFFTRDEALQVAMPGSGNVFGPVQFWVRGEDEEDVRCLLDGLNEDTAAASE